MRRYKEEQLAFSVDIINNRHWWRSVTGTGGAVRKGATPSVEQPGGRGFKPRLRSLLD